MTKYNIRMWVCDKCCSEYHDEDVYVERWGYCDQTMDDICPECMKDKKYKNKSEGRPD